MIRFEGKPPQEVADGGPHGFRNPSACIFVSSIVLGTSMGISFEGIFSEELTQTRTVVTEERAGGTPGRHSSAQRLSGWRVTAPSSDLGVQVRARLTNAAIHQVKNGGLGRRRSVGLEGDQGD